ncbi:MAG: peptidyl-dipeptidase, partial [Cellvibrio sp.]|nr:peptidyl-dipeptidase [Cellvibrio sp.]
MKKPSKLRNILFSGIAICGLVACSKAPSNSEQTSSAPAKSVDEFIAEVNKKYLDSFYEYNAAQWTYVTYINDDTALLATKANEKFMALEKEVLAEARLYKDAPMSAETKKAYINLTQGKTLLPPDTPEARAELARLGTHMEGVYGAGKYCKPEGTSEQGASEQSASEKSISEKNTPEKGATENCRDLNQLSDVLAKSRDYNELVDAWAGWHSVARAYRSDYQRYIEIANAGARAYGFSDLGASWKSGYDMPASEFEADVERLWLQVEPLYKALHCKVRTDLAKQYGADKVPLDKPIPAHLLGNMWSQQWDGIYDLVEPYP